MTARDLPLMNDTNRWQLTFAVALLAVFIPLYFATRSTILIGDAEAFSGVARAGDPSALHYGEPGHFLQVPLSGALWRAATAAGAGISIEAVMIAFALAGTLAAAIFVGLIAADLLRSRQAAWLASLLFGLSLHSWTQWNGELYGLAVGFVCAAIYFALRGRVVLPACLWALGVLSHSEIAFAAPAMAFAVFLAPRGSGPTSAAIPRAVTLLALAGALAAVILLAGSWTIGKWSNTASLERWIRYSYDVRQRDIIGIEAPRALKGLMTAHTVAGHYWRDIMTGRGHSGPAFASAAAIGLILIGMMAIALAASLKRSTAAAFAIVWLLPTQMLFNWRFLPTVEKYHGASLPGLTLLVTTGLLALAERLEPRRRIWLYSIYLAAFAGLNLVGGVLPIRALGRDNDAAVKALVKLNADYKQQTAFVTCDSPRPIFAARVEHLRIRSIWNAPPAEIEGRIMSWIDAQAASGRTVFLVDRVCFPDEWITTWSQAPFNLGFLEHRFVLEPTGITNVPTAQEPYTNPFAWRHADIMRLVARNSS